MINARKELIDHIRDCSSGDICREVELVRIALRRGDIHKIEGSLDQVLPQLGFTYDNGYGGQEMYGYIWYADGTWSERCEYDGSEWWEHKEIPNKDIKLVKPTWP